MVDQSLVSYIKQNIRDGFPQNEIQTALVSAGWETADINEAFIQAGLMPQSKAAPVNLPPELAGEGLTYSPTEHTSFLARHGRLLIVIVVMIILLPVLAYGGFWAYQRYAVKSENLPTQVGIPTEVGTPPPAAPQIDAQAVIRDEQRLKDIESLQTALETYFTAKKTYPKLLDELMAEKILTSVPTDPKSGVQYLYSPFGQTSTDYSLSFILESDIGTLKKGLNEVSPGKPLKPEIIKSQEEAVRGATTKPISASLQITDLSQSPFYAGEEVTVSINSSVALDQVFLLVNHMKLTDEHFPFNIRFSAPRNPGEYPVQIFGFTNDGETFIQATKLTVKP
ncbi:MAG: hypothetical protein A2751_02350 [Candidatus Doudnabacteria bacterium RIFCSPHIGHO2_01_FULL_46_14]|uniref:Uncharacterized protein n=1 Tax=Candidatus Doudnabacteria bacterium RIFCSPHIGHO2_01_FULL_46_14 TaxID=1817824 RepID=A0A1F5NK29_9BACT|nr:MAG: hypothetical protein A2751_02350 [Candidatus Doudnabacteria bacterium RIFCSPHIGHO2_01_FULL_46_14]